MALAHSHRHELMDTIHLSPEEMSSVLKFLEVTNKYFGGSNLILKYLKKFSSNWDRTKPIKILDVGAGAGDIPIAIVEWARKNNFEIEITAIDLVPEIIEIAKIRTTSFPEIEVAQKNFFDIDETTHFDFVIASLLFHHIPPNEQIHFLQKADHLAKKGIIISDLDRSWPSLAAVWALSRLLGNRIVKHDAPLSVKRAFGVGELNQIKTDAGVTYLNASREPWFRVSLAGEK